MLAGLQSDAYHHVRTRKDLLRPVVDRAPDGLYALAVNVRAKDLADAVTVIAFTGPQV
jgi:hypothetical protein